MKSLSLALLALVGCFTAVAQLAMLDESAGLQSKLYVVRGKETAANWSKDGNKDAVESVKDPKKGEELWTAIFFTGASIDKEGKAKVTYSLKMTMPDGTVFPQENLMGAQGPATKADAAKWFLASASTKVVIPAAWPSGKYKFEATVKDNVANTTHTATPVTLDIK